MLISTFSLTGFEGRVIVGSWYGNKEAQLRFGEEFHRNRLNIISSQVSFISPTLTGRWNKERRMTTVWKMLKRVHPERLITHRIDIDEASRAFELLDLHQDEAMQVVLTYKESG